MAEHTPSHLAALTERLLLMASHAEAAVDHAVKALARRDDDLARRTDEEDSVIDAFEVEIDETAIGLLARGPSLADLRMITTAMKISHNLERVGDEATTISRRCLELSREPQLAQAAEIPRMAKLALALLKDALDAFVQRDPARARAVIPGDQAVDALNKQLHRELAAFIGANPAAVGRGLNLMVVSKCLERIADHAKNVAELVVYVCEGEDIRHAKSHRRRAAASPSAL